MTANEYAAKLRVPGFHGDRSTLLAIADLLERYDECEHENACLVTALNDRCALLERQARVIETAKHFADEMSEWIDDFDNGEPD